jgi:hypothetical protein
MDRFWEQTRPHGIMSSNKTGSLSRLACPVQDQQRTEVENEQSNSRGNQAGFSLLDWRLLAGLGGADIRIRRNIAAERDELRRSPAVAESMDVRTARGSCPSIVIRILTDDTQATATRCRQPAFVVNREQVR